MGRPSEGGHIRKFPRHKTAYRLISVEVDGVRRQRFEHRLVMEQVLGRPLLRNEVVHHKDGNGLNNAPENLELMNQTDHVREHLWVGPNKWDLEKAKTMRKKGASFAKIASHFGVTGSAIRNGFKSHGVDTKDLRHGTTKWDFELAKKLYQEGVQMVKIAEKVGVKAPSVRKAFLKYGVIPS